jgi:hypothetical protein
MMVDDDDHIATAQVVLRQIVRQHCFSVEVEGHSEDRVASGQSSVFSYCQRQANRYLLILSAGITASGGSFTGIYLGA